MFVKNTFRDVTQRISRMFLNITLIVSKNLSLKLKNKLKRVYQLRSVLNGSVCPP